MQHLNDREEARTSLYLVRRAEALLGALEFFLKEPGDAVGRRLVFLAQIEFWEWEMENLIYSFTQFEERSKAWEDSRHVTEKLREVGVLVDAKIAQRVRWRRGAWKVQGEGRRVAPAELLAETVSAWNRLIDVVDVHFVKKNREKIEKFNIQARKHLLDWKKSMPVLGTTNDEARITNE